ncbi:MAG: flippase [Ignavibacteriales bacterium]|nr:flippase [Ignavibacteriales bacterium]
MNGSIAHSVAKNTTVMIVSQSITWASSFVLMLFLPRYLGSEEYGKLFLAISITTIFQMVVEFGGGYYIAKEVSREREKISVMLSNSIAFRFVVWLGGFVALMWIAVAVGYSPTVISVIYVLGFSKLWEGVGKVYHSTCQGLEMMHYPAISAIVERVVVTSLSVTALLLGADVVTISVIMALSTLLNFFILSKLMKSHVQYLWTPRLTEMARIAKASIPYFMWMMFSVVYYRIDAVMLSLMTPENVVGWYGAAYRFFDVLMFLPSIYSMALFPLLSKLWMTKQDAVAVTTQKSLQFIVLAGIPISVCVFTFSHEIIELFFGTAEYAPSILLLRIFSVGLLLIYVDFVLGTALFASDRQRQWTLTAFFAMLLNPALNYFFIPFTQLHEGNGGIGAALATLLTEYFVMIMALRSLPRSVFQDANPNFLYKGSVAAALMGLTLWLFHESNVHWMLTAVVAIAVYCAGLVNLKAIEPAEMNFLRSFFSLKNLKNLFVLSKESRT